MHFFLSDEHTHYDGNLFISKRNCKFASHLLPHFEFTVSEELSN